MKINLYNNPYRCGGGEKELVFYKNYPSKFGEMPCPPSEVGHACNHIISDPGAKEEATYLLNLCKAQGRWGGFGWRGYAIREPADIWDKLAIFYYKWKMNRFPTADEIARFNRHKGGSSDELDPSGYKLIQGFPSEIVARVLELKKAGYVSIENYGEEDVIFPTVSLVETIIDHNKNK